jgi:hypothetical protein
MTIDLQQAIRNALAGSSGQQPVDAATLRKFGTAADIAAALESMRVRGEVNTARVMRGGKFADMYWLTGMAGQLRDMRPLPPMRPLPARPEPVNNVQPKTATTENEFKESAMNDLPITIKHVMQLVVATPGIKRAAVTAALVLPDGSNAKQVTKIISNAINNKVLTQTTEGEEKFLFVGEKARKERKPRAVKAAAPAPAPAKSTVPETVAQLAVAVGAAVGVHPVELLPQPASDEPFTLMLSDDGHLHIGIGEEMYHFNETQTARLHRFMNRVMLGGARA